MVTTGEQLPYQGQILVSNSPVSNSLVSNSPVRYSPVSNSPYSKNLYTYGSWTDLSLKGTSRTRGWGVVVALQNAGGC